MKTSTRPEILDLLEEQLQDSGYRVIPTTGKAVAVEEGHLSARIRPTKAGLKATARLGPLDSWWAYPILLIALGSGIFRNVSQLLTPNLLSAPAWWLGAMILLECAVLAYVVRHIWKHRKWMHSLRGLLHRLPNPS